MVESTVQKTNFTSLTQLLERHYKDGRQSKELKSKKLELRRYILNLLLPHYFVDLYVVGSSVNELASIDSDADICLVFTDRPEKMDQTNDAYNLLLRVQNLLSRDSRFAAMNMIAAKVPLLKFRDVRSNINFDLNVHNIIGIRNTRLLKAYVECDDRFPKLVVTVKKWAKVNDINSAHRKTLSSYSIALMVLHYLQVCSPPVLPCLQTWQPGKFGTQDDYTRYSLLKRLVRYKSTNRQSLGELFFGFLEYFINFDYNRCAISIRLGRIIPKSVVRAYKSPKNSPTHWSYLSIEEPFDRTNTASAVHDPAIFERIIKVFKGTYCLLRNNAEHDIFVPLNLHDHHTMSHITAPIAASTNPAVLQYTTNGYPFLPAIAVPYNSALQ